MACCYDDEGNPEVCSPPKEEPDCLVCDDRGCPTGCWHPYHCDCADCANAHVIAFEFLADLDTGLVSAGPFADEPPF